MMTRETADRHTTGGRFGRWSWGWAVLGAVVLAASASGAGDDPIKVARTIDFAESARAPQKVRDECSLQTKVTHFIDEFSDQVTLVDGDAGRSGRVLVLEISEVHAPGGGAWSGPKVLGVKGTLQDNGKHVAGFTAKRYSGGGMFGGYKGTCSIVGRCAKAIGKDIARWLESPTDGAHLGDG